MKRCLYEQICSHLSFNRSSVDMAAQNFPEIDPQIIRAIYMRKSLYLYRVAHAKLIAQDHPQEYFYNNFRLRCAEKHEKMSNEQEINSIIKEMGEEVDLPPCLMARLILKSFINIYPSILSLENKNNLNEIEDECNDNRDDGEDNECNSAKVESTESSNNRNKNKNSMKIATTMVTKILREPQSIRSIDPILFQNLIYCLENDFLTSPATDQFRNQIGLEWENFMHQRLKDFNVLFHSEADMRAAGYPKTPDALLAYPVEINGHIVNWIESKALFSDQPTHQTYLKDQYWPYYNRFGPGLVIYWFGFLEDIINDKEREKGILVMDRFPDEINKIVF